MLTLQMLKDMPMGTIFAQGNDEGTKWVAVRGGIHDWAIYCGLGDVEPRELKDKGVKQESLFFYDPRNGKTRQGFESYADEDGINHWFISRFTISELLEKLTNDDILKYSAEFYRSSDGIIKDMLIGMLHSPDALADCLIWKLNKK